jgi:hypothetical protein
MNLEELIDGCATHHINNINGSHDVILNSYSSSVTKARLNGRKDHRFCEAMPIFPERFNHSSRFAA